jgi:hypothetical protein
MIVARPEMYTKENVDYIASQLILTKQEELSGIETQVLPCMQNKRRKNQPLNTMPMQDSQPLLPTGSAEYRTTSSTI